MFWLTKKNCVRCTFKSSKALKIKFQTVTVCPGQRDPKSCLGFKTLNGSKTDNSLILLWPLVDMACSEKSTESFSTGSPQTALCCQDTVTP